MDTNTRPKRQDNLEIHTVADGYIVYDKARDRVHYLNHTASLILELCDGAVDEAEISSMVAVAFDLSDTPVGETRETLENFAREGLIE